MLTLRELKYLIRDALFEGVEQDRQELIKLYSDQQSDISRLGPKWIMWLMARFGPSAKLEEVHPFEDALATVKSYSQRDAAISQKYNSSKEWRQAVDQAFPNRKWKNPADVMTMSADDMETLLAMSQRKKQSVDVNQTSNVENDRIGKVGPWNLWMPSTRENSCQIAGYDPATMKPYTSWCTARTAGSNLFYSYVCRPGIILFYLIRDDAKTDTDRLSIGFVNGEPDLSGNYGGVTVDADNGGLIEKDLRSLLGGHYAQIMATLQDVANKYQGNHPAQKKFAEAAQSLSALKNLIKGLSKDEQNNLLEMIAEQKTLSVEVAEYLCQFDNEPIRSNVACNPNTPIEVLTQLAQDEDPYIRQNVAKNSNTPVGVLEKLAKDTTIRVRLHVAQNPSTPIEVLTQFANDVRADLRFYPAKNENTPSEILVKLAQDSDSNVRSAVARNPSTHVEILTQLAQDKNEYVLNAVAENSKTTAKILTQLANNEKGSVRDRVAVHANTPAEILAQLANDQDRYVRYQVAKNVNTPVETLQLLATDDIAQISTEAQHNLNSRLKESNMFLSVHRLRKIIREASAKYPGGPIRNALSPTLNNREQIGSLAGNTPMDTVQDEEGLPDHLLDPTLEPEDCYGPVPPDAEKPYLSQDPFARNTGVLPTPSIKR